MNDGLLIVELCRPWNYHDVSRMIASCGSLIVGSGTSAQGFWPVPPFTKAFTAPPSLLPPIRSGTRTAGRVVPALPGRSNVLPGSAGTTQKSSGVRIRSRIQTPASFSRAVPPNAPAAQVPVVKTAPERKSSEKFQFTQLIFRLANRSR